MPVLMFLLTAALASAGAFTPAAIAIVAPVALALGSRFGISTLAMGLVIVPGRQRRGVHRRSRTKPATMTIVPEAPVKVHVTPMRLLTLAGLVTLLILTTGFGLDVGVASLVIAVVLVCIKPGIQKPAIESLPWSPIILVTGIVTYVGMLEEMGALKELEAGIASLGNDSVAALITSYVVAIASAFASTTGILGVISPIVTPIAADPLLTPLGGHHCHRYQLLRRGCQPYVHQRGAADGQRPTQGRTALLPCPSPLGDRHDRPGAPARVACLCPARPRLTQTQHRRPGVPAA